jgi:hypothetical protein
MMLDQYSKVIMVPSHPLGQIRTRPSFETEQFCSLNTMRGRRSADESLKFEEG